MIKVSQISHHRIMENETIKQHNNAKVNLKRGRNSFGSSFHSSFTISEDGLNGSTTNVDRDDYRSFLHLYNYNDGNQDDNIDGEQQEDSKLPQQQQEEEEQNQNKAATQQLRHQQHQQSSQQQNTSEEKHLKKHPKSKSNPKLPKSKLRRRTSDQRVMARRGAMILGTNDESKSLTNVINDFSKLNPF